MSRSGRRSRFERQPDVFRGVFQAGQAVDVFMADHWEAGTVLRVDEDRVEVRVGKRKASVSVFDARNVVGGRS